MNITEIIKTSLKYPQTKLENLVFFTVFIASFVILSVLGYSRLFNVAALKAMENTNTVTNALTQFANTLPESNWFIFAILFVCSFIIFIFINGYIYIVYEGKDSLPNFDDFKLLSIQGLKVMAVTIVYYLIPMIILAVGFYLRSDIGFILTAIGVILLLIVGFFIQPMAIAHMASNNDLKTAFNLSQIIEKIKEITLTKYLMTIIFALFIQFIIILSFQVISVFLMGLSIMVPVIGVVFIILCAALEFLVYAYLELFLVKTYQLLYKKKDI